MSKKSSKANTLPADEPTPLVDETIPPTALYEVLSPFKLRGAVVKPPVWIELTAEEAAPYQAAGVLGSEPGVAPENPEGENGTEADGGTVAAGDAAAADAAVTGTGA